MNIFFKPLQKLWKQSMIILSSFISVLATLPDRPNIIFIMLDDLGQEWISGYGANDIETPNIDNLMETGLRFNGAYSMPKCTPSRVSLLTGQYPYNHGWIQHWDVPRWSPVNDTTPENAFFDWEYNLTFARVIKSRGYKTAAAGKWQLNDFRSQPMAMEKHGFDEWAMWTGAEGGEDSHVNKSGKRYWNPYINTRKEGDITSQSQTHSDAFGPDKYFEFVEDFLGRHKNDPMMIYYAMALPHGPFTTTPLDLNASTSIDKHKAMVKYADHLIGKLVNTLDSLDIRKRTLIFFTTDNGTTSSITGTIYGNSLQGGKDEFTENGPWAPFIVNAPGIVPPGKTDAIADFTDLFPTFTELAGATIPEFWKIDGTSMVKILTGEEQVGSRQWILSMGNSKAYYEPGIGIRGAKGVTFHQRVLRNKDFKVIVNNNKITSIFHVDSVPEGTHGTNLLNSDNADVKAAIEIFNTAFPFPEEDQWPKYRNSKYSGLPEKITYDPDPVEIPLKHKTNYSSFSKDVQIRFKGTFFKFNVKENTNGRLSIRVWDMLGRNIAQPFSGRVKGGESYTWQLKDIAGGTYVIQFMLNKKTWFQRAIVASK